MLTFGGLKHLADRLGDLLGRRRVFVAGVGAFVVASLLCGLANSAELQIAARFVQGGAAATMASLFLGILVTMCRSARVRVKASECGWASGRTIGFAAVAVALGALFVLVEARVRNPLMPRRVFESRTGSVANVVRALFAVGMFGAFFMGALYFPHVLGYSAI